jgi:hypothetical protein
VDQPVAEIARVLNESLDAAEAEAERPDRVVSHICPECTLSWEGEVDAAHCSWCEAPNPDVIEALTWAELRLTEQLYPEALAG